jgi:hypothetical protein
VSHSVSLSPGKRYGFKISNRAKKLHTVNIQDTKPYLTMVITGRAAATLLFLVAFWPDSDAFILRMRVLPLQQQESAVQLQGWFDNLFPAPISDSSSSAGSDRQLQYPEQYPATYDISDIKVSSDDADAKIVRPLLKQTQLEFRRLRVAYNARSQGWNPRAFHRAVDGQGAAIILAKASRISNDNSKEWFGGYNPKGWSSLGGARPSVAAFLWYTTTTAATTTDTNKGGTSATLQKLRKVGGGGLACAKDDGDTGIWLGADGLVIPLDDGNEPRRAQSKLGTYFERGPENLSSILGTGAVELSELKVLVGVYEPGEEIPYAGGVLDMTSG